MSTRRQPVAAEEAWARVRIHLNLRDDTAACAEAKAASALTRWERFGPAQQWGMAEMFGGAEMPVGWLWLEPANYRVLLNADVLSRFVLSSGLAKFVTVIERVTGPCFRFYNATNWESLEVLDRREH